MTENSERRFGVTNKNSSSPLCKVKPRRDARQPVYPRLRGLPWNRYVEKPRAWLVSHDRERSCFSHPQARC